MPSQDSLLPRMFRVRQRLTDSALADIESSVVLTMNQAKVEATIFAGQRVAVAVGSRGIANLPVIVHSVVGQLKQWGAKPFIVPAMGSHGGATAQGQIGILQTLGITQSSIGCPVLASMATELIRAETSPLELHFAQAAIGADHVFLINRVKPHTRLTGQLQSGLVKMALVGLGKHAGAKCSHHWFGNTEYRLDAIAQPILETLLARTPLRFGLAIIEDALEQTSHVECVPAAEWLRREPELLNIATRQMPGLPFDHAHWLMIDQIGKEISGTGMDTNVIGRKSNDQSAAENEWPKVDKIYVRGLTKKTNGNATGVGIAKCVHARVIEQMDNETTRINCETSDHVSAGMIHQVVPNDRQAMQTFAHGHENIEPRHWKWLAIKDTLSLTSLWCSEAYHNEAQTHPQLQIVSPLQTIRFDTEDNWKVDF